MSVPTKLLTVLLAVVVVAAARGRRRRAGSGLGRRLGTGPCRRLPRPEHPALERRLLRLRHPELRRAGPGDQHPGVDIDERGRLDPPQLRRSAQGTSRLMGRAGRHLGPQRRPRRHEQRLRHVLRGDGGIHGGPVHRDRDRSRDEPAGPLHRLLADPRRLPERHRRRQHHRQRELRREHRPRHLH